MLEEVLGIEDINLYLLNKSNNYNNYIIRI